jgi:hypothetical protein
LENPTLYIKTGNSTDPSQTILLMIAGENYFSFALLNHLSKELVEFGYYSKENIMTNSWTDFFEQNEVLSERYYQSAIAFKAAESILVPAEYYKSEDAWLQLKVIYGESVQSVLITEHLPDWNMYNLYRVPEALHSAISKRFVTGKFWNSHSVHLKNFPGEKQNAILVDFVMDEFSVIVFKNNALQLAQSFTCSSPEDVLYYLLKICQQLGLSQQEVKIILAGLIEKDSAIYRELYKYFIHLEFENLPDGIRIADALSQYPRHYFSSICKLATCVL